MDANQNRREFKFVLPPHLQGVLRARVAEMMVADRGAENGYPVLSEYFDTDERSSYWQKQMGVPNRRRIRSRVYGQQDGAIPPSAFIEVKHKLDGVTVKRRVSVGLDELTHFSEGTLPVRESYASAADERVFAEIRDLVNGRERKPVVQIRYHRYAFDSGPEGTIRITFDLEPRCRFRLIPLTPDDPDFELPLLEPGSAIMEVKTIGPVPYWFRNIIGEFNLVPRGFSKYTAALEMYEFKQRQSPRPEPAKTQSVVPPPRKTQARQLDEKGRVRPTPTAALPRRASTGKEQRPGVLGQWIMRIASLFQAQKVR